MAQLEPRGVLADGEVSVRPEQTGQWAWGICWLMFASTVLNYMDRQAISWSPPRSRGSSIC